jgi:hypothetical protein
VSQVYTTLLLPCQISKWTHYLHLRPLSSTLFLPSKARGYYKLCWYKQGKSRCLFNILIRYPLVIYPVVVLTDHGLTFNWGTCMLFSIIIVFVYSPINSVQLFRYLYILSRTYYLLSFLSIFITNVSDDGYLSLSLQNVYSYQNITITLYSINMYNYHL